MRPTAMRMFHRAAILMLLPAAAAACYDSSPPVAWDGMDEGANVDVVEETVDWDEPVDGNEEEVAPILCTFEMEGETVVHDAYAGFYREAARNTHALFTGSAFAVVFDAALVANDVQPEVMFSIVSPGGEIILDEVKVPDSLEYEQRWKPELAFNGSDYAVVWEDTMGGMEEIMLGRITGEGAKLGPDVRLTESEVWSEDPSIVFDGGEYAVIWFENSITTADGDIMFIKLDVDGNRVGDDLVVAHVVDERRHQLLFTGSEFDVVWTGEGVHEYDTLMARVSRDGMLLDGPILLTPDWECSSGFMVPVGSSLAMTCHGNPAGTGERYDIYLMTFTFEGEKVGGDTRISYLEESSGYPAMASMDGMLAIGWESGIHNGNLFMGVFTPEGVALGDPVSINPGSFAVDEYHVIWTGSDVGVNWSNMEDVYLTRAACAN